MIRNVPPLNELSKRVDLDLPTYLKENDKVKETKPIFLDAITPTEEVK